MKRFVRIVCAFGCLALLSDIAPMGCVARADIPPPPRPLHRIGYEIFKRVSDKLSQEQHGDWKYPENVSVLEREEITRKLEGVQSKLQTAFDERYKVLAQSNRLDKVALYHGQVPRYRYENWIVNGVVEANKKIVLADLLEGDSDLEDRCKGSPLEDMLARIKCPKPEIDENSVKLRFREWAMTRTNGFSDFEKKIMFEWQFFSCRHEQRPWLSAFSKEAEELGLKAKEWFLRSLKAEDYLGESRESIGQGKPIAGFEDFECHERHAEFLSRWFGRAIACGYVPKSYDRLLLKKYKENAGKVSSGGGIRIEEREECHVLRGFDSVPISPVVMRYKGDVCVDEIKMAAQYCKAYLLGKAFTNDFDKIVIADVGNEALKEICRSLAGKTVEELTVLGGTNTLDISCLSDFCGVERLRLKHGKFKGCPCFQGLYGGNTTLVAEDCHFVDAPLSVAWHLKAEPPLSLPTVEDGGGKISLPRLQQGTNRLPQGTVPRIEPSDETPHPPTRIIRQNYSFPWLVLVGGLIGIVLLLLVRRVRVKIASSGSFVTGVLFRRRQMVLKGLSVLYWLGMFAVVMALGFALGGVVWERRVKRCVRECEDLRLDVVILQAQVRELQRESVAQTNELEATSDTLSAEKRPSRVGNAEEGGALARKKADGLIKDAWFMYENEEFYEAVMCFARAVELGGRLNDGDLIAVNRSFQMSINRLDRLVAAIEHDVKVGRTPIRSQMEVQLERKRLIEAKRRIDATGRADLE